MTDLITPFITKTIPCPICKAKCEQRFFRQRLYAADERESDQHVTRYQWLNDKVAYAHPPYYFLFYCPSCFYTDNQTDFCKPLEAPFGQEAMKNFKAMRDDEKAIVQAIGQRVKYDEIEYTSALYLHLLAVFIHSRGDDDHRDLYKIGRYILRIAWLYRESVGEAPATAPRVARSDAMSADEALAAIRDGLMQFEVRITQAAEGYKSLRTALERRMDATQRSAELRQNYAKPADHLAEILKQAGADLAAIKAVAAKDAALLAAIGGGVAPSAAPAAGDTPEQRQVFIERMRAVWPELPMTEEECMRQVIALFENALLKDERFLNPDLYFSTVFLVADLYIRANDYPGALNMVGGIYRNAAQTRQQVQEQLRSGDIGFVAQRRLDTQLERLNNTLERTGDYRLNLIEQYMEREMPRMMKIIDHFRGRPELIEPALLKSGVPKDITHRLKEPGAPLEFLRQQKR